MNNDLNPDDGIVDNCAVCNKPVLVVRKSILWTESGNRWSFDCLDCFMTWIADKGYAVRGEP